jgi:hypothetical protein
VLINIKKAIHILVILAVSGVAQAEDYKISTNKEAFGLPLTSTINDYIKRIGTPDGEIRMGKDRTGLLYGQKLLMIFWNNKLWEIQIWQEPPIKAFRYVRNGRENNPINIQIDNGIAVGITRDKFIKIIKDIKDIEGDEAGVIYKKGESIIEVHFTGKYYDNNIIVKGDTQKIDFIKITYEPNNQNFNK